MPEALIAAASQESGSPTAAGWTAWGTRFVFFTGKGGVGKTTVAAASAVALADGGRRVLVVCTDPASNLDDVLGMQVGTEPTPVPGAPGLWAMNIDPASAAAAYRERVIGPYRGRVPEQEFQAIAEQLSGQCTVEIAAFDEFARLLGRPELTAGYDHVIFDTAPTGHTLRLLSLPSAWSGYIETSPRGASCLGPLAGLDDRRDGIPGHGRLARRSGPHDPRPGGAPGAGGAGGGGSGRHGTRRGRRPQPAPGHQRRARGAASGRPRGRGHRGPPAGRAGTAARGIAGPAGPARVPGGGRPDRPGSASGPGRRARPEPGPRAGATLPAPEIELPDLSALAGSLAQDSRGVVMVMGKGGVGKTRVATGIALALARRGHRVHLSTTDPAGDPAAALGPGRPPALSAGRIDPAREIRRYTAAKLASARDRDPGDLALLEEDLRSPCTEEIAVFAAFSRLLGEARDHFVVLDTAPTGHTLLLLDTTGAYHREVLRTSPALAGRMTTPLMRLQDPAYTKVLIVTLAETTPVQEAADLQEDLRRAGVEPHGWIINATLTGSGTRDPLLRRRAAHEQPHIRRVREQLTTRVWQIPWHTDAEMIPQQAAQPAAGT